MDFHFRPKLLDTLPGYSRGAFLQDFSAGITVGVLALPLAMAFAIASGMSPASGIWTAIVAGLLISLLGGSRVQIGGPTGAFIPIIYGIVATHSVDDLLLATTMSGILLFALGAFRLGNMIRFIPRAVITGFTSGIAVVIFLSQINDFLGLRIDSLPGEFFGKMKALWAALPNLDLATVFVSVASLVVLVLWNRKAYRVRWMRRLPGPLAVLIIFTLLNALGLLPTTDTIGSPRFGGIPQELPRFGLGRFNLETVRQLISPAIAIALLGAIESLLSARVADAQIDDRHDPNQELMAQGIANVVAPLFGGFAATGAIARTATNIRSGGLTPIAGVIHALTLLAIVLLLAPLASNIPLSTLSAIVVVVALNMGDWHALKPRELARYSNNYRGILLGTFFVTIVFGLTLAVELGMVLASLFFIYRISDLTRIEAIGLPPEDSGVDAVGGHARVQAWKLSGSLFFGAANKLETALLEQKERPDVTILDIDRIISIDTTGLDILQTLHRSLQKYGGTLILCHAGKQPASLIRRSGFLAVLGAENLCTTFGAALERAAQVRAAGTNAPIA
ncbi:MAG: STAS domain-containing protein [Azoarcus sp.]|jgi:SulP family sulfate permease|nr:STAS domain-containing protein [Azoarcus sp.]